MPTAWQAIELPLHQWRKKVSRLSTRDFYLHQIDKRLIHIDKRATRFANISTPIYLPRNIKTQATLLSWNRTSHRSSTPQYPPGGHGVIDRPMPFMVRLFLMFQSCVHFFTLSIAGAGFEPALPCGIQFMRLAS